MNKTPSYRQQLLSLAIDCVQSVLKLNGVTRIAMIGSLTTNKPDPKDADILISVKDDLDLSRLARLSRSLQGRAQSLNRGGEVFLANQDDQYIGRICPWKDCGPGIRASCDTLHCGIRKYLHDDFDAIRLSDDLVKHPPIVIWPKFSARVIVPEDLSKALAKILPESLETKYGAFAHPLNKIQSRNRTKVNIMQLCFR